MLEITGEFGFVNESLKPTDWIRNHLNFIGRPVYEVVRLIDSVPLFLDDHLGRLAGSCAIVGLDFKEDRSQVKERIQILAKKCNRSNGNLKVIFGDLDSVGMALLILFIPHFFPSSDMYQNGVAVTLLHMERPNPNAKLVKEKPKELGELIDHESGYYEVLLVNSRGEITEGSRSNVFFIKDSVFYTSPTEDVLPGITRQKVLELIKGLGMEIRLQRIHKSSLIDYESIFLTGTSPGVLPVKSVNGNSYNVDHPAVKKVMICYQQLVERSIG